MGYSVLYIAFGIVALWLLGEVLLQYKARLRWRLLAFAGFMGVVAGVATRQVVLIVLGALAFGAGQAFVTLSYKRGFSTGWALGGRPGSSRRRRGAGRPAEPVLEVTPVEPDGYEGAAPARGADADVLAGQDEFGDDGETSVFQPVPMHDDSGEYPLYDGQSSYTPDPYTSGGYEGYGAQGYESWNGEPHPAAAGYDGAYGYDPQQTGWGSGQAYGFEQAGYQEQQPAAASYNGTNGGNGGNGTNGGGGYDAYGTGGYAGYDTYGAQAAGTGDWTPQQHPQHAEAPYQGQQPPADPYAGQGQGYGYDPQAQPYIPHQQQQSPYDQQHQPQYTAEPSEPYEYTDPYDPYRY
ncbi:hypothetical protein OG552_08555 [Streptomyces sp. NBC_01476]|uniref:hypothetical protein n=1 Tax=Streptomyces sp. NBC_01476 TaxID=2903881 RepID=UPI002E2EA48F|nr:hypothetical protein [Streptomyces sp. NBC_01476]